MASYCDILYNRYNLNELCELLEKYVIVPEYAQRFKEFYEIFETDDPISSLRLKPDATDEEVDVMELAGNVVDALSNTIDGLLQERYEIDKEAVIRRIKHALCIHDGTQDTDFMTNDSVFIGQSDNLDELLDSMIGNGLQAVKNEINNVFGDAITRIAWVDNTTGLPVDADEETLNGNIWAYKAECLKKITDYLKRICPYDERVLGLTGELFIGQRRYGYFDSGSGNRLDKFSSKPRIDVDNYNRTMSLFNEIVVKKEWFREDLLDALAKSGARGTIKTLVDRFAAVSKALRGHSEFLNFMKRNGYKKKSDLDIAERVPVYSNELSNYAQLVKRFVDDLHNDEIMEAVDNEMGKVDECERTILALINYVTDEFVDAVDSFIMLRSFDSLLDSTFEGEIYVDEDHMNSMWYAPKQYGYGRNKKHFNTSWQGQDYIGSEKYTAKKTEIILNTIKVSNWRTGRDENRRVRSAELRTAFSVLLDNIKHNSSFIYERGSDSRAFKEAVRELRRLAYTIKKNPMRNIKSMLEMIFKAGAVKGVHDPLISNMRTSLIEDLHWSVIKSVYEQVFSDTPKSYWTNAVSQIRTSGQYSLYNLIAQITGHIDRNHQVTYLNYEFDRTKGYYVPVQLSQADVYGVYRNQRRIVNNRINSIDNAARIDLNSDYGFDYRPITIKLDDGKELSVMRYTATLWNGEQVSLDVDEGSSLQLFVGDSADSTTSGRYRLGHPAFNVSDGFFESFNDVRYDMLKSMVWDGKDTYMRLLGDPELNDGERRMLSVMKLLDDTLDTHLEDNLSESLDVMKTYNERGSQYDRKYVSNPMMSLMKYAFRGLYANRRYIDRDASKMPSSLRDYLQFKGDNLYQFYLNDTYKIRRIFSSANGQLKYVVVSHYDKAFNYFLDAIQIQRGEFVNNMISDGSGTMLPVAVVNSASGEVDYDMVVHGENVESGGRPLHYLLFGGRPNMVKAIYNLRSVKDQKTGKMVNETDLNTHEAIFKDIVCNFYGSLFSSGESNMTYDGKVIVVPAVYSDSEQVVGYLVNPFDAYSYNEKMNGFTGKGSSVGRMTETLGAYYMALYKRNESKLRTILGAFAGTARSASGDSAELRARKSRIRAALSKKGAGVFGVDGALSYISEHELVSTARSLGLTVSRDYDYRLLKGSGRGVNGVRLIGNELMEGYAELYAGNTDNPAGTLSNEKLYNKLKANELNFIEALIKSNVVFQFLSNGDRIENWTEKNKFHSGKRISNSVNSMVENYVEHILNLDNERHKFYGTWVDPETGSMVIARCGDMVDGKLENVRNVRSMSDIEPGKTVELNPVLITYMYNMLLLSNNLNMFVNGNDLSCSFGSKSENPFNKARAVISNEGIERFNELGYGRFDGETYMVESYEPFMETMLKCETPNDLAHELRRLESVKAEERARTEKDVIDALRRVKDASFDFSSRMAMYDNQKRGQSAVGTIQRVQQGKIDGLPNELRTVVIEDVTANVLNPRGDGMLIDATEGSGLMTMEASILFDKSVEPYDTGNLKKPMWRQLDDEGNSLYCKFATHVINNETMKRTMRSRIKHFNLYKKLTNMQWGVDENGRSVINLLIPYSSSSGTEWINRSVLESDKKKLCYTRKNNIIYEIKGFNGSTTKKYGMLYYTVEKKMLKARKRGMALPEDGERVYHIFYDETGQDGKVVRSKHRTASSLSEAERVFDELNAKGMNPHTVNSVFELFEALGGMNCVDEDGIVSERNHNVIVNFMNWVGSRKNLLRRDIYDQESVDQPLKKLFRGAIIPVSSMKRIKPNVNPMSSWYDDTEFDDAAISTDGLGVQLNPGKDSVESTLTEPTQAIAACSAYGYTFDKAYEMSYSIGRSIARVSKNFNGVIDSLLSGASAEEREEALNRLYYELGRLAVNARSKRGTSSLADDVLESVKKIFGKYADRNDTEKKIPYSMQGIYTQFSYELARRLTEDSVKRAFSGEQAVMVPAYDQVQLYEFVDSNGNTTKLFAKDVLKRAQEAYRNELVAFFESLEDYDPVKGSVGDFFGGRKVRYVDTDELEAEAVRIMPDGGFSRYYTPLSDANEANDHYVETYVSERQNDPQYYKPQSWFMPSDVVDIVDMDGNVLQTIDLNDRDNYMLFKMNNYRMLYGTEVRFRTSLSQPRNLRPSTLRWQYKTKDGRTEYANWFDLTHVWNAMITDADTDSVEYRRASRAAYLALKEGRFKLSGDNTEYRMLDGTFENVAAEAVINNVNMKKFGIRIGDSLADVLQAGESYFTSGVNRMRIPAQEQKYDVALLRSTGNHLLLKFGVADESDEFLNKAQFANTRVNEKDEIVYTRKGLDEFVIGRWVDDNTVIYDSEKRVFTDLGGNRVNQDNYRKGKSGGLVQRKVMLVNPYKLSSFYTNKAGVTKEYTNDYYAIADMDTFAQAYGADKAADAFNDLVDMIWKSGSYELVQQTNSDKGGARSQISMLLDVFEQNVERGSRQAETAAFQRALLGNWNKETFDRFVQKKDEYVAEQAHKKFVSFQDALKIISSRIPAQSLQSFMAMKIVGWTDTNDNVAYVSHYQAYLQGSDYDVDKANIIQQCISKNGLLQSWSPYFDYTTVRTLEASKHLPIPKGLKLEMDNDSGADITQELESIVNSSDLEQYNGNLLYVRMRELSQGLTSRFRKSEEDKIRFVISLASALSKIEHNGGKYKYDLNRIRYSGENLNKMITAALNTMQHHENHKLGSLIEDDAYKNGIFANMWSVSTDLMNREASWTEVNTKRLDKASEKYDAKITYLTPFNILSRAIGSYNAHIGKQLVGMTANGIKAWFNIYFYWNNVLRHGSQKDIELLRFRIATDFIRGRKNGPGYASGLGETVIDHIPDLEMSNQAVRSALVELNGQDISFDEMLTNVDTAMSEYLSAAADNGKKMILGKINATKEYMRMYTTLSMLGFEIDDIVEFMTSPYAETLTNHTGGDVFQFMRRSMYGKESVDYAGGLIDPSIYMHGKLEEKKSNKRERFYDEETGLKSTLEYKAVELRNGLLNRLMKYSEETRSSRNILSAVKRRLGCREDEPLYDDTAKYSLENIMQALIFEAAADPYLIGNGTASDKGKVISISEMFKDSDSLYNDYEIRSYLADVDELVGEIKNAALEYTAENKRMGYENKLKRGVEYYISDYINFKEIYYVANELAKTASSALKLNQGLPGTDFEIMKMIDDINSVVSDREKYLEIVPEKMYGAGIKANDPKYAEYRNKVIDNIVAHNGALDKKYVESVLSRARSKGILRNFNVSEYMLDKTGDPDGYRSVAREYIGIIKGMNNIMHMVENIPQYNELMNLFVNYEQARKKAMMKARVVDVIGKSGFEMNEENMKGVMSYVDKIIAYDYASRLDNIGLSKSVDAFDGNFDMTYSNEFRFDTMEGIASFRYYVQGEFLNWLRKEHAENGFVKNLVLQEVDGQTALCPAINMNWYGRHASSTSIFNEMYAGLSKLQEIPFSLNSNYTVADMIALYNIMIFGNVSTRNSFTDLLGAVYGRNRILTGYFDHIANMDNDPDYMPKWDKDDMLIHIAPEVTRNTIKFHREKYVKRVNETTGYDLMKYDAKTRSYNIESMLDSLFTTSDSNADVIRRRRGNFDSFCPFRFPVLLGRQSVWPVIAYKEAVTDDNRKQVLKTVKTYLLAQAQAGMLQLASVKSGGKNIYKVELLRLIKNDDGNNVVDPIELGEVRINSKSEIDKVVNYDLASELIIGMDLDTRKEIANKIQESEDEMRITSDMISSYRIASNITLQQMMNRFGINPERYGFDEDAGLGYNIIMVSSFRISGKDYSGKVVDPYGRTLFVFKSYPDVKKFLRYLGAKESLKKIGGEKELEKRLNENEFYISRKGDIDEILERKSGKKGVRSRLKDTLLDFLENADKYKSFNSKKAGDKHMVNQSAILSNLLHLLTDDYYVEHYGGLTDDELDLWGRRSALAENMAYKFTRRELYDFFKMVDQNFESKYALDDFMLLDRDELKEYIDWISAEKNYLWLGRLKIRKMTFPTEINKIEEAEAIAKKRPKKEKGKNEPQTETAKKRYTSDRLEEDWMKFKRQKAGLDEKALEARAAMPKMYRGADGFMGLDADTRAELFNKANISITVNEGIGKQTVGVKATVHETTDGKKFVLYEYEIKIPAEEKARIKSRNAYVEFVDEYDNPHEKYGMAYGDEYFLKPVNADVNGIGSVKNGVYNRMFVYDGYDRDGKYMVAVSKNIQSPYGHVREFSDLRDALEYIDKYNEESVILDNCLMELHMENGSNSRLVRLRQKGIFDNQVVTILGMKLRSWGDKYDDIPVAVRSLLEMSVEKAKETFEKHGLADEIPEVMRLRSPEEMMLFIMRMAEAIYYDDEEKAEPESIKDLTDDFRRYNMGNKGKVNELFNEIENATCISFKVHNLNFGKGVAELIWKDGSSLDVNGTTIIGADESVSLSEYIGFALDDAVEYYKKKYNGLDIVTESSSEMLDDSDLAPLNLDEESVKSVRAFIFKGRIYINTSNATATDPSHEIVHILFGIIKTKNYDKYIDIIEENKHSAGYYNIRNGLEELYPNMASQDLDEEAVARLLANKIDKNHNVFLQKDKTGQVINGAAFIGEEADKELESINNVLKEMYQKSKTGKSDLAFDDWVDEAIGEGAQWRRMTNLISSLIVKAGDMNDNATMTENSIIEECD